MGRLDESTTNTLEHCARVLADVMAREAPVTGSMTMAEHLGQQRGDVRFVLTQIRALLELRGVSGAKSL